MSFSYESVSVIYPTATTAVTKNSLVTVNDARGIALSDASLGETYTLAIDGMLVLTSPTGVTFSKGEKVFIVLGVLAKTGSATEFIGFATDFDDRNRATSISLKLSAADTSNAVISASFNQQVVVTTASQLSGTLDSNIDYFLDGQIDMGTTQILVPEGGLNISGYNFDNSGLFSSEDNYTMFTQDPAGTYAGYLRCQDIYMRATGSSSKLMSLDNDGNNNAVELLNCNIGDFSAETTSIGDITDYRLFRLDGCALIRVGDGIELNGTMSQIVVSNTIALALPAMTFLKEGTALSLTGDSRSNMNFNSVDSAAVYTDIDEANIVTDGGFRLTEFRTTATDALPNLEGSSVKALYRFCEGVRDSYIGGTFEVTTGATTTIASADTPVKMAGTTTSSDLSSFDDDGGTNNRLRYISALSREFTVEGIGTFTGGNNDVMGLIIRHYNSSDVLQGVVDSKGATLNGGSSGTRAENLVARGNVTLADGDYLEFWVENRSDTTNITTVIETQMTVTER